MATWYSGKVVRSNQTWSFSTPGWGRADLPGPESPVASGSCPHEAKPSLTLAGLEWTLLCNDAGLGRAQKAPVFAWMCHAERRLLTLIIPLHPCTFPQHLKCPHSLGPLSLSWFPMSQGPVIIKGQRMSICFPSPPPLHYTGPAVYTMSQLPVQIAVAKKMEVEVIK